MGVTRVLLASLLVGIAGYMIAVKFTHEPALPKLNPNPWWGPGQAQHEDATISEFKINISQEDVDDLYSRLSVPSRLTPGLEGANFTYGMTSDVLTRVLHYWYNSYDWRAREEHLNTYRHYKTQIEGLNIHFLRAPPAFTPTPTSGKKVVPLLLIHGWPGSFVEFYRILPLLTNPYLGSDVYFDVICPSIPGYGFSEGSAKMGLGAAETAQIFHKLMKRLGFEKYYLQGGDWGSLIGTTMSIFYPESVYGLHLNMATAMTPGVNVKWILGSFLPSGLFVDEEDQGKLYPLLDKLSYIIQEMGYAHIQATKPDTIGAALAQSPVSLAVYILEKFSTWTSKQNINKPDGGLFDHPISMDSLLDNICIYWFTNSITTSQRFYAESMSVRSFSMGIELIPVRVPTGIAVFPEEIMSQPKNFLAHKFYDIVTYTEQPAGGHFAAMERPELLANDFHRFVIEVESRFKEKPKDK